ncbi:MAG: hypothetical protein BWY69_00219 [Planctomycetes bacterium ADurb.Bin401]|nr:MAG: hypothetical protein BWY69_00219 [Planctomycetes bacterium ADurb.Bin401]
MRSRKKTIVCSVIILLTVILSINSSANALTLVKALQYTLFGNGCFYVPGDVYPREFFLDEAVYSGDPDVIVGQFLLAGDSQYNYEIRGGTIQLTPAAIIADQSYTSGFSFNPYIAKGLFESTGVTLSMSGYITTAGGTEILSDYVTILEGNVTADFIGLEQLYSAGFLTFQLNLEITGGELFTGAQTGFALSPEFTTVITLRYCTQFGREGMTDKIKDFTSDIGYAQPSIVQINAIGTEPVPEPVTMILFTISGLLIYGSKRK